jgi:hypothetical protein
MDRLGAFVSLASDPGAVVDRFVTGPDLEMFDAMNSELQIVPSSIPFQPGRTILDIPIRAIPRATWPSKPIETNEEITARLYPVQARATRAAPALSILGAFYADSGIIGVAIGMGLLGIILRYIWNRTLTAHFDSWSLVTYAVTLPLLMILIRGTIVGTLALALFAVVPIIVMPRLLARTSARATMQHSSQTALNE